MAITCGEAYNNTCDCACFGNPDLWGEYEMDSTEASQTLVTGPGGASNCCTTTCTNACAGSKFDDVVLSGFDSGTSPRPWGGTGQAVTWRKQSGASEGGLFGLSTNQLLIAGAVGVGAYLILKKRKK